MWIISQYIPRVGFLSESIHGLGVTTGVWGVGCGVWGVGCGVWVESVAD